MVSLLVNDILNTEHRPDRLQASVLERYRNLRIEPPATEQIRRLIMSALAEHEKEFCATISGSLDTAMQESLNALLQLKTSDDGEWTTWQPLKSDPGKAGLGSIKETVTRLLTVREIGLPIDLFKTVPPKLLERYAKRAAVEEPFELRRHTAPLLPCMVFGDCWISRSLAHLSPYTASLPIRVPTVVPLIAASSGLASQLHPCGSLRFSSLFPATTFHIIRLYP